MTAVLDIKPIEANEKITNQLLEGEEQNFEKIKNEIKIKIFDFDNDFDNYQIWNYVCNKIEVMGLKEYKVIEYGDYIKYIKVKVHSYEDVIKIASINGVKSVDFFQEYFQPKYDYSTIKIGDILEENIKIVILP